MGGNLSACYADINRTNTYTTNYLYEKTNITVVHDSDPHCLSGGMDKPGRAHCPPRTSRCIPASTPAGRPRRCGAAQKLQSAHGAAPHRSEPAPDQVHLHRNRPVGQRDEHFLAERRYRDAL